MVETSNAAPISATSRPTTQTSTSTGDLTYNSCCMAARFSKPEVLLAQFSKIPSDIYLVVLKLPCGTESVNVESAATAWYVVSAMYATLV